MNPRDRRYFSAKHRGKEQEKTPQTEKTVMVRRCNVCGINKPVWSNKNGIRCKECHEKREDE